MTGGSLWREHLRPFVASRSLRQLTLAAGALVLLASGLFGGLERAEPEKVTSVKAGQTVDTGPFDLTVTKVVWAEDLADGPGESELGRFLVVHATVTSTEKDTVSGFVIREALRIHGLRGFAEKEGSDVLVTSDEADPRVVSVADQVRIDYLNPGLTYDVQYVWEQTWSRPLPSSVDLTVFGHGFRQSNIDEQEDWFDRFPIAVGSFAVTELSS
ncbi:hypothetical protein GCM10022234_32130 [Aeromicrobium panaciterrae]|uniref:hypothetical protein n=1 Tax=Aeromicrobium panaciterrae TaxID=363861 RepID=UPI0031DE39CB